MDGKFREMKTKRRPVNNIERLFEYYVRLLVRRRPAFTLFTAFPQVYTLSPCFPSSKALLTLTNFMDHGLIVLDSFRPDV